MGTLIGNGAYDVTSRPIKFFVTVLDGAPSVGRREEGRTPQLPVGEGMRSFEMRRNTSIQNKYSWRCVRSVDVACHPRLQGSISLEVAVG